MSIEPIQLGVLGYGHFIRTNFIRRLAACESIHIAGVYNRGPERRQQAADDGYWATDNLDELLARPDLDAVLIGTANAAHHDQAIACARAGKHILCEKPMALNLTEIDAMVAAADQAGVITHVNHGGPYTAAFEKFQELVNEHAGQIMQVWVRNSRQFGTWAMGARHGAVEHPDQSGGWTFHHTCHFLNIACVLLGHDNPATRAYHIQQQSTPDAPSEELVTSLISFASGATAQINDGTTIGGFGDLGVIGARADLRLLGDQITMVRHDDKPDPDQRPGNRARLVDTFDVPTQGKALTKVGDLFAQAIRSGDDTRLLSFEKIAHEYRVLEAMSHSAQTGQAVNL